MPLKNLAVVTFFSAEENTFVTHFYLQTQWITISFIFSMILRQEIAQAKTLGRCATQQEETTGDCPCMLIYHKKWPVLHVHTQNQVPFLQSCHPLAIDLQQRGICVYTCMCVYVNSRGVFNEEMTQDSNMVSRKTNPQFKHPLCQTSLTKRKEAYRVMVKLLWFWAVHKTRLPRLSWSYLLLPSWVTPSCKPCGHSLSHHQ